MNEALPADIDGVLGPGSMSGWRVSAVPGSAAPCSGRLVWRDPAGTSISRLGGGGDRFEIALDGLLGARLDLRSRRAEIVAFSPDVTPQTVRHFWFAQVLPRLVASATHLVLHGAVLQRHGRAVVFLGPSGIGKSTLAASLSRAGWRLAGDDSAVLTLTDGRWMAGSIDQSLRLRRDSAEALIGDSAATEPVASYSAKRRVLVRDASADILPLSAVWVLAEGRHVATAALAPAASCMTLIENAFRLDPSDPRGAADTLALAAGVVEAVSCARLSYPRRYAALAAVREHVESALAGTGPRQVAQ